MVSAEKDEAVAKHQTHKKINGIYENIRMMVICIMIVKMIQATLKTKRLSREFSKWEIVR